ncbi:MAG: DUF2341 domain-containing protein [Candidatus Methanospirareceae archaeon]
MAWGIIKNNKGNIRKVVNIFLVALLFLSSIIMIPMPVRAEDTLIGVIRVTNYTFDNYNDIAVRVLIRNATELFYYADKDTLKPYNPETGNYLYYWVEKWDTTNLVAVLWIKIYSLPKQGSVDIYLYSNGSASGYYNETQTFTYSKIYSTPKNTVVREGTIQSPVTMFYKFSYSYTYDDLMLNIGTYYSENIYETYPSAIGAYIHWSENGDMMDVRLYYSKDNYDVVASVQTDSDIKIVVTALNLDIQQTYVAVNEDPESSSAFEMIYRGTPQLSTLTKHFDPAHVNTDGYLHYIVATNYYDVSNVTTEYIPASEYTPLQPPEGSSSGTTQTTQTTGTAEYTIQQTNDEIIDVDEFLAQNEGNCVLSINYTYSDGTFPQDLVDITTRVTIYYPNGEVLREITKYGVATRRDFTFTLDFSENSYYVVYAEVVYHLGVPGPIPYAETEDGKYYDDTGAQIIRQPGVMYYYLKSYFNETRRYIEWAPLRNGSTIEEPPSPPSGNETQPPSVNITRYTLDIRINVTDSQGVSFFPAARDVVEKIKVHVKVVNKDAATVFEKSFYMRTDDYYSNVTTIQGIFASVDDQNEPYTVYSDIYIIFRDGYQKVYSDAVQASYNGNMTVVELHPFATYTFRWMTARVIVYDANSAEVTADVTVYGAQGVIDEGNTNAYRRYTIQLWDFGFDYKVAVSVDFLNYYEERTISAATIDAMHGKVYDVVFYASTPSGGGNETTPISLPEQITYSGLTIYFSDKWGRSLQTLQSTQPLEYAIAVYDRNGQLLHTWSGLVSTYTIPDLQIDTASQYPLQVVCSVKFRLYNSEIKIVRSFVPVNPDDKLYFFRECDEYYVQLRAADMMYHVIDNVEVKIYIDPAYNWYFDAVYDLSGYQPVTSISSGDSLWLPTFLRYEAKATVFVENDYVTASHKFYVYEPFQIVYVTLPVYYISTDIRFDFRDSLYYTPWDVPEIVSTTVTLSIYAEGKKKAEFDISSGNDYVHAEVYMEQLSIVTFSLRIEMTYNINDHEITYYTVQNIYAIAERLEWRPFAFATLKTKTYVVKTEDETGYPLSGVNVIVYQVGEREPWSSDQTEPQVVLFMGYTGADGTCRFTVPPQALVNVIIGNETFTQQEVSIYEAAQDIVYITWRLVAAENAAQLYVDFRDSLGQSVLQLPWTKYLHVSINYIDAAGVEKTIERTYKDNFVFVDEYENTAVDVFFVNPQSNTQIFVHVTATISIGGQEKTITRDYALFPVERMYVKPFVDNELGAKTYYIVSQNSSLVSIYITGATDPIIQDLIESAGGRIKFAEISVNGVDVITIPASANFDIDATAGQAKVEGNKIIISAPGAENAMTNIIGGFVNVISNVYFIIIIVVVGFAAYLTREYGFSELGFVIILVMIIALLSMTGVLPSWVIYIVIIIAAAIIAWMVSKSFGGGVT